MKDLENAKSLLIDEELTLAVVKKGEVIFKSKDRGIKPIYFMAKELKEEAKEAVLADKVIGRGAAILYGYIGIKEVYGELISKGGIERLDYYEIPYSMDNLCEYVKNREKTDSCPIEKLSKNIEDPRILIESIEKFFKQI